MKNVSPACSHFALSLLGLVLSSALCFADQPRSGESCAVGLPGSYEDWTEQEHWVWKMVCGARVADLRTWRSERTVAQDSRPQSELSARFIKTILLQDPWRSAIPSQGVRIAGAHFHEPIDLGQAEISHQLFLTNSQFDDDLDLRGAKLLGRLSLDGSRLTGVTLEEARIDGDVAMAYTEVTGDRTVNMDGIEVGRKLVMTGAKLPELSLRNARIGSTVDLDAAMTGGVNMDSIVIGQHMSLNQHAHINWLWLGSGKIGGFLRLDEAEFDQRDAPYHSFDAPGLEVSGSLTMLTTIFVDANMRDAKIGGDLSLAGAKQHDKRLTQDRAQNELTAVDLTGASIGHALILGNQWYGPVQWRPSAYLSLRNTTVREVDDGIEDCGNQPNIGDVICSPGAWPNKLDLAGFEYQRFGSSDLNSRSYMAARSLDWWLGWLQRQQQFSPQPYEKLAFVLRGQGLIDISDDILVAERHLERLESPWRRRLWLTVLWLLIDYGYHPFRALWWVLGLAIAGVAVLRWSGEGERHHLSRGTYSVDMLLPIVRLREMNYKIELEGWARYYFYAHKVVGYILASFLIAGLSGLTK